MSLILPLEKPALNLRPLLWLLLPVAGAGDTVFLASVAHR